MFVSRKKDGVLLSDLVVSTIGGSFLGMMAGLIDGIASDTSTLPVAVVASIVSNVYATKTQSRKINLFASTYTCAVSTMWAYSLTKCALRYLN